MWLPVILALVAQRTVSVPVRGNEPWTVILCKYSDKDHEPHSQAWVREWMYGGNTESIASMFYSMSNGVYTIEETNVSEWVKMPWSRTDVIERIRAERNATRTDTTAELFALFDKTKQLCADHAASLGVPVRPRRITLLNSESTAVFGRSSGVLLSPRMTYSAALVHEMVHSMNIGHSYSEDLRKVFPHGSLGEYGDRYDLMSTANAWMHASRFGWAGPGLAGPHLDYLGWLPADRLRYFGGSQGVETLVLSSLSVPHAKTKGTLLVMLPYDRDEGANVYTVEYRTRNGSDVGIRQNAKERLLNKPAVLIHHVKKVGDSFYSYLVSHRGFDELTEGTEWVRFTSGGLLRVRIDSIVSESDIVITLTSTFDPTRCLPNERQVEISSEKQSILEYTNLFKLKYVFDKGSEAADVSHVCLPKDGTLTAEAKEQARGRARFFERRTWGQNECVEGRVWRAVDPYDYVCVPPHRRAPDMVAETRRAVASRSKTGACPRLFTRRLAHDKDLACVTAHERARVIAENRSARRHYKHAAFFNGHDDLVRLP